MVVRHNRRSTHGRRDASRVSANRTKDRHDLLPWADPYIASLMRTHELQKGMARESGGSDEG